MNQRYMYKQLPTIAWVEAWSTLNSLNRLGVSFPGSSIGLSLFQAVGLVSAFSMLPEWAEFSRQLSFSRGVFQQSLPGREEA